MLFYCLKCSKNREGENPKVVKIKNVRVMVSLNCAVYAAASNEDLLKSKKLLKY